MKKRKASLLLIILLTLIILLGMPVILLPVLPVFLYIRWFNAGDFTPLLNRLERIDSTKLLLACGLTLASAAIVDQRTAYEFRLGFPAPFIFYYNFPTSGEAAGLFSNLFSKVLLHLLDGLVDIVTYYLLLSVLFWAYQKSTAWLHKRHVDD